MKKYMTLLYWSPRILGILSILFISMFALDAFEPGILLWQQLVHFAMHLIPSLLLAAMLFVAWRWEQIGGWLFLLTGIGFAPFIFMHNYDMNQSIWISLSIILVINFPFIITGLLFLLHDNFSQKFTSQQHGMGNR
ncbi:MAG: hypothetical protein MUE95_11730 [Cyclobacteriaceae bacterium]|jgi:hypothetical protein|nr:hypothetical protein [Cyclobacteriaceae bacterium]